MRTATRTRTGRIARFVVALLLSPTLLLSGARTAEARIETAVCAQLLWINIRTELGIDDSIDLEFEIAKYIRETYSSKSEFDNGLELGITVPMKGVPVGLGLDLSASDANELYSESINEEFVSYSARVSRALSASFVDNEALSRVLESFDRCLEQVKSQDGLWIHHRDLNDTLATVSMVWRPESLQAHGEPAALVIESIRCINCEIQSDKTSKWANSLSFEGEGQELRVGGVMTHAVKRLSCEEHASVVITTTVGEGDPYILPSTCAATQPPPERIAEPTINEMTNTIDSKEFDLIYEHIQGDGDIGGYGPYVEVNAEASHNTQVVFISVDAELYQYLNRSPRDRDPEMHPNANVGRAQIPLQRIWTAPKGWEIVDISPKTGTAVVIHPWRGKPATHRASSENPEGLVTRLFSQGRTRGDQDLPSIRGIKTEDGRVYGEVTLSPITVTLRRK
ncbi:MAG: hypothetical protein AAGD00_00135 [Planctomycetota bacterium]